MKGTKQIRVVSDGGPMGTKVLLDGESIPGVTRVEIMPIELGALVKAVIHVVGAEVDVAASLDAGASKCRSVGVLTESINDRLLCDSLKENQRKIQAEFAASTLLGDRLSDRKKDARRARLKGDRAYSDAFDHIIVNCGGSEHGYDLACAIQLRDALNRAISNAALPDDEYR